MIRVIVAVAVLAAASMALAEDDSGLLFGRVEPSSVGSLLANFELSRSEVSGCKSRDRPGDIVGARRN